MATKITADQLAAHRLRIRQSLHYWCEFALADQGLKPAPHHKIIIEALEAVANGECDRLMISLPPGSAKSTYASVLFPAWFMANNPRKEVILASHSASLAEKFSKVTKEYIQDNAVHLGIDIRSDEKAVERWGTTNKASYRCLGAGAKTTGFRADVIICDDLVSGRAVADSPSQRDTLYEWYNADLFTRRKKGCRIIVIGTRWHADDISGRLLSGELKDEWRIIKLPALCDDPENDLLGRELGEPLWAEWESTEELARARATIGERNFSALYQQKPVPDGGLLIDVSKIQKVNYDPSSLKPHAVVRAWDLASTAVGTGKCNNPDYTVGAKMALTNDGRWIVLDVVKIQGEPHTVEKLIMDTAKADGYGVAISIPQDPGAGGKAFSAFLARQLAGYSVDISRETGTKIARATPFIAQAMAGNILVLSDDDWNKSYLDELSVFPAGIKDDQVDATSRAFNYLTQKNTRSASFFRFRHQDF